MTSYERTVRWYDLMVRPSGELYYPLEEGRKPLSVQNYETRRAIPDLGPKVNGVLYHSLTIINIVSIDSSQCWYR